MVELDCHVEMSATFGYLKAVSVEVLGNSAVGCLEKTVVGRQCFECDEPQAVAILMMVEPGYLEQVAAVRSGFECDVP